MYEYAAVLSNNPLHQLTRQRLANFECIHNYFRARRNRHKMMKYLAIVHIVCKHIAQIALQQTLVEWNT